MQDKGEAGGIAVKGGNEGELKERDGLLGENRSCGLNC